jgi:hypothetical protein
VTTTIGGGPAGGGPGVGFGPTATNPLGTVIADSLYAVGITGLSARSSAHARAGRKATEPAPDGADAPAAAAARERIRDRPRRAATAKDHGNRYEYLDGGGGGGPFGFVGATAKSTVAPAAGLTTVDGDRFDGRSPVPMLPSSWRNDSPNVGS